MYVCKCFEFAFTGLSALTVNITKDIESLSLVVQWDAVKDFIDTIYTLRLDSENNSIPVIVTLTEQTSYTITGLILDTVYTIAITAANMCGQGPEFTTSILFVDNTSSSISPTVTTTTVITNSTSSITTTIPIATATTTSITVITTTSITIYTTSSTATSSTPSTSTTINPSSSNTFTTSTVQSSKFVTTSTSIVTTSITTSRSSITTVTATPSTNINITSNILPDSSVDAHSKSLVTTAINVIVILTCLGWCLHI